MIGMVGMLEGSRKQEIKTVVFCHFLTIYHIPGTDIHPYRNTAKRVVLLE